MKNELNKVNYELIKTCDEAKGNKAFRDFLKTLPSTFDRTGTEVHRGRNVLRTFDVGGPGIGGTGTVVVKRFHDLLPLGRLLNTFCCKPKGRRAYDNSAEMLRRGIGAARPLALVEVWRHGLYKYSFYVAELAEGERLTGLIRRLKAEGQPEAVRELVSQYAEMVKDMHERGVLFRDLNGGNVICRREGGRWRFTLVDTDRATLYDADKPLSLRRSTRDLILMKPELGTNVMFQEEYLRLRGLYSPAAAAYLLQAQMTRYERKQRWYRKLSRQCRRLYRKLVK